MARMTPSHRRSLKECVRNFTWAWHAVITGTGGVSALAARFHFGAGSTALKVITLGFFFLNLLLFVLICAVTIVRYWMFPEVWSLMVRHPTQSLFIGTFAMGAATLINVALVTNQDWNFGGTGFLYALWGLWWLDSVVSFVTAFGMIYAMSTRQQHSPENIVLVWILPIVPLVVASSTGGLLAEALRGHSIRIALLTTAVSFTMLIIGLSLALMMITAYLTRLILYGPPDVNLILSAFVALGPFGQGGFSLLINGKNLSELLPLHMGDTFPMAPLTGQMLNSVCFCGAWILWSMGIAWITIALCSIYAIARKEKIPFSMGFWGIIFPNGVFALLSVELGAVLDSPFFHYFGAIWSIIVLLLWIFGFAKTIPAVLNTSVFRAPYLEPLPHPADEVKMSTDSNTPATTRSSLTIEPNAV